MLIGLGEEKQPIDFGFTRSKDKVTRLTFVNKVYNVFRIFSRELLITEISYLTR